MRKWGLALGGGGILGFAHLGILQVLEEHGFWPDVVAGTSAGGAVAGLLAAGFDFGGTDLEEEVLRVLSEEDALAVEALPCESHARPLTITGILRGDLLEAMFRRLTLGKHLWESEIPVSISSVDIESGSIVVFTSALPLRRAHILYTYRSRAYVCDAKISEAIRASTSVPGVFSPKKFRDMSLVDGGIRDMVPAYEARRMGACEVIAVDLGLHAVQFQKTGDVVSILSRSFALAARESVERHLNEHASLILQPEVFDVGFPTPAKVRKLIQAGRECAEKNLFRIAAIAG